MLGAKFTVNGADPLMGEKVNMVVVCCPAGTEVGARAVEAKAKSATSVAFHAVARAFASTDPRPLTTL